MKFVCMSRASFLFRSWRKTLQKAGIVDISLSFNNDCDRQLLLLFLKVNLIPEWFVMVVCSCFVENCVSVSFGSGVKFELGCNAWCLGSVRIFEHRDGHCSVAIDLLFCNAKSDCKSVECSDCRQRVRWVLPLRSWSVIGLSNSLMLVFGLFVIYILHYIIYIYESLLIQFFSYDFYISFYRKSVII